MGKQGVKLVAGPKTMCWKFSDEQTGEELYYDVRTSAVYDNLGNWKGKGKVKEKKLTVTLKGKAPRRSKTQTYLRKQAKKSTL